MASTNQSFEAGAARGMLGLPAALLRIMAGRPIVRDGQTLDVQCQLLLKIMRMRGATLGSRAVAEERRQMVAQSQMLAPQVDGEVDAHEIQLDTPDGPLAGRYYKPEGCPSPSPAIVFYHGGGFVLGDLDTHDGICRALADRAQAVVIAVDYRLAPEHPAPAAARDAVAAFRDIVARAEALSVDAQRLAVVGDSAGGNLAAVVAQQTRHDATAPCYQVLFYPVVDFAEDKPSKDRFAEGFLLEKASMDWFEDHYIPKDHDKRDPWLSPLHGAADNAPPAWIVTAGFDPLRDEGEAYGALLETAGVRVETHREPSLIHGFLNFAGGVKRANKVLDTSALQLRAALGAPA
ncbi:alpha/beta hydrolase [Salinisphaera sp. SPP-AMP-43]|uniref:alpha/beta hydrolase n=1 Tax=Salinisphaera sp. SPP-AMP-43 TaxID=3121288 RepID=UPI003C6E354F